MAQAQQPSDRTPAFTGLIVGAILTVVILYATVQWTNTRFAAHAAEGAAATQAH
ncbi:MAG: hypothetical protein MUF40_03970 [Gemmatimonadaceae bacterium]|jgi:hypothetical protein|nr:hypothetical protein [Gemmatimonadaceae bacterium]